MPDVNNEDGSPNYDFIIGDFSVVRPQAEPIALPIPPVMLDRCSTCDEFFSMDEIDTHQCLVIIDGKLCWQFEIDFWR
jgi:hypothetical protein